MTNEEEIFHFGGIEPPPDDLRSKNEPETIPRICIECGKIHDTGVQNTETGEMTHRTKKCYDCIMKNCFSYESQPNQIRFLQENVVSPDRSNEIDFDGTLEELKEILEKLENDIPHLKEKIEIMRDSERENKNDCQSSKNV